MVLGLEDQDALPRLSPPVFWCLVALILVVWLLLRVRLARRQIAAHGTPVTRLGFIKKLAGMPRIEWILGALAVILAGVALLVR